MPRKSFLPTFQQRFTLLLLVLLFAVLFLVYASVNPTANEFGAVISSIKTKEKVVALTFDDGPNEPYTSQIIDILDANHVKATFFIIGKNVEYYPEVARKLLNHGEVIENHSYSHSQALAIGDFDYDDADMAQLAIFKATNVKPHFFRPPHGLKTPWELNRIKAKGMLTADWSDDGIDYYRFSASQIAENVLRVAHPGSIILLHDGYGLIHGSNRSETVKALPFIIKTLKVRGYRFVTVPELVGTTPYLD